MLPPHPDTLPGIPAMDTSIRGDFREIEINLHHKDLPQRVDLRARKRRYCELGETSSGVNETVDADFKFLTGTSSKSIVLWTHKVLLLKSYSSVSSIYSATRFRSTSLTLCIRSGIPLSVSVSFMYLYFEMHEQSFHPLEYSSSKAMA